METNEDHPNEDKQRLLIQNFLQQGSQTPSFASGTDSKSIREVGSSVVEKLTRSPVCSEWCGDAVGGHWKQGISCDWFGGKSKLSLVGPELEREEGVVTVVSHP